MVFVWSRHSVVHSIMVRLVSVCVFLSHTTSGLRGVKVLYVYNTGTIAIHRASSPLLFYAGVDALMELSLFGVFALLWLFNPSVLVHTYLFWACFAGVCLYFAVAAFIYEVILSWLSCAAPVGMHSPCQTRLDVRLPLRVGLCILVLCHRVWNVAGALVPKSITFVSRDIPSLVTYVEGGRVGIDGTRCSDQHVLDPKP